MEGQEQTEVDKEIDSDLKTQARLLMDASQSSYRNMPRVSDKVEALS